MEISSHSIFKMIQELEEFILIPLHKRNKNQTKIKKIKNKNSYMLTMFHICKVIITYLNCQISFKVLRMNNIVNLTIPCYLMPLLPFFCMHYSFHYFGKFYDKFCSGKKSFTFSHYSRIWYIMEENAWRKHMSYLVILFLE